MPVQSNLVINPSYSNAIRNKINPQPLGRASSPFNNPNSSTKFPALPNNIPKPSPISQSNAGGNGIQPYKPVGLAKNSQPGTMQGTKSVVSQLSQSQPTAQGSYQGGQSMPAVGTPQYTQSQQMNNQSNNQNTNNQTPPPVQPQDTNTLSQAQGGLLQYGTGSGNNAVNAATGYLQGQANGNNPAQSSINGLQGIAQNQTQGVIDAQKQYSDFAKASPFMSSDVRNNPNVAAEVSVGRGQALGQTLSAEQQALASNVSNALGAQGQQITAGNDAGSLALTGQGQQIGAATNAGTLGYNQQGQQIGALGTAGSISQPVAGPGGVLMYPQNIGPAGQGGNSAFGGGQANANVGLGASYQNNSATLGALTGSNDGSGNSGMVGDFNSALQQSGLNSSSVNLGNALKQGLSANTSGQFAGLQNNFQNVLAQYAKILGAQTVNQLMTSSNNQTIAQFFASLSKEAQSVQQGNYSAGTGQSQSNQNNSSIESLRNKYHY